VKRKKSDDLEGQTRFVEEDGDVVLYVEVKLCGRFIPIAKRYSRKNWINLEPGWTVRGLEPGGDYRMLEIEYNPEGERLQ
jgi:hypothetical protein